MPSMSQADYKSSGVGRVSNCASLLILSAFPPPSPLPLSNSLNVSVYLRKHSRVPGCKYHRQCPLMAAGSRQRAAFVARVSPPPQPPRSARLTYFLLHVLPSCTDPHRPQGSPDPKALGSRSFLHPSPAVCPQPLPTARCVWGFMAQYQLP